MSRLRRGPRLQPSVYSYATMMTGLGDQEALRLRFDVLTKIKQPELHRYWTQRDRAATRRLFGLVAEVLRAIEAGAFHPIPGGLCKDCPLRVGVARGNERCGAAWAVSSSRTFPISPSRTCP